MLKRDLTLACLFLMTLTMSAPWAKSQQDADVPAYNAAPPAKTTKLPAILGRDQIGIDEDIANLRLHVSHVISGDQRSGEHTPETEM